MSSVFAFLKDESGATAIEYGLIAAGISIVIIASSSKLLREPGFLDAASVEAARFFVSGTDWEHIRRGTGVIYARNTYIVRMTCSAGVV
jgi:Flp/Fap pilin component